ncbi:MAG: antibiotic biosynthesis monooxygenase [Spongiibacteraceae bacterium]
MFIAMNRFQIALGREEDFIAVWKNRESYLDGVPGFKNFNLLRGATTEQHTLFASHSVWESRAAFDAWTHSDAFRNAHRGAGDTKGIYLGHPQLELFESVL